MRSIVIAGCGSALPDRVVSNDEIEVLTGYSRAGKGCSLDTWARRHHGGRLRRWAAEGEATSDLALRAAQRALDDACVSARDIDLIVMSTFTSDHRVPPTAAWVQAGLGARAKFLQLDSACTGFVDGVWVASSLMRQFGLRTAVVVAADILSRLSSPSDFLPQTVFGDAGAAAVLRWSDDPGAGLRAFSMGSEGELGHYVFVPGGGSRLPLTRQGLDDGLQYWRLKFHEIRQWALGRMIECTRDVVARSGIDLGDVAWFVPHQASNNIVYAVAHELNIPRERVVMTYEESGNVSGASIAIALDHAKRRGTFRRGDWIVMSAVGAGMAWSAMSYQWHGE